MGSWVTALSAGASDMSGWLLMGLPGAVFIGGISESWIAIGLTLGAYLNWRWVAGRLRVHTEKNRNALTLPDYFTYRFEDKSRVLRILSALVILLFFTIYCASGVVAGARLFESTFGMSYDTALWVGAAATITYTFFGGFLAVSWTDTVQATLMIFALILTPVFVIIAVGGIDTAMVQVAAQNAGNLDMFKNLDFIAIISLMAWGLGYFGQPHILARFMAADSHHSMTNARRISMTWMVLCLGGAVAIGFFGLSYFSTFTEQAGGVTANLSGSLSSSPRSCSTPGSPACCSPPSCGGDEYPQLPAAGLLQRHHRGSLQAVPAQERLPAGAGVGWPRHGAGDCAHRHRRCHESGKPGAGAGELRLGRLWCRLRPRGAALRALVADDPQRRPGGHAGGRPDRHRLEAVRLAGTL